MRLLSLTLAITVFTGCSRPGDGDESLTSKREWSILQSLESRHRDEPIQGIYFHSEADYHILSLMADDSDTRIWIMLDPKKPPFYKQMPGSSFYSLSDKEFDEIRKRGHPISTVTHALESHIKN